MPKIVRFDELGGPEVLKIEEETSKQPGKGEVRLRVQAVGLNRAEAMFVRGHYLEQPKLPAGIGYEAAGVVEAVGGVGGGLRNEPIFRIFRFGRISYGGGFVGLLLPEESAAT